MESINIPEVKLETEKDNQAVFLIQPFYPGYGTTVGNALRRVLLTSLPGSAVSAFKIVGADHEFSTIDGIREDIVEIMLNLKGLRFILHQEEPIIVKLKTTKAGDVTGKNIKLSGALELVNPDHHIATVTGKNNLEMEIQVERGRGYILSDNSKNKDLPIGMIAVDSVFSPVGRCSIKVQNTRVGDRVDYDKLTLELETDGTITPQDALKQASQVLLDQFSIFGAEVSTPEEIKEETKKDKEETVPTAKTKTDDAKNLSIDEINLSIRTNNALTQNNIKKIKDILNIGRQGLLDMKGVGERAVTEIDDKLEGLGLEFK